jgi:putative zinc finger/helix-turn-helix YgiT family protein
MDEISTSKGAANYSDVVIVCPSCGGPNVKTENKNRTFPYGCDSEKVELTVQVPVRVCTDCDFSFLDRVAERLCHEAICQYLKVMSPSQIRDLRELYSLNQSQFAKLTGLGEATLSRWERGVVIQNRAYDSFLYLLGFEENIRRLQERTDTLNRKVAASGLRQPSFRSLEVTEEILDKQRGFELRPCMICT